MCVYSFLKQNLLNQGISRGEGAPALFLSGKAGVLDSALLEFVVIDICCN